jgi:hypothetical membrane protein
MQTKTQDPNLIRDVVPRRHANEGHVRRRVVAGALLALTGMGMIMAIITNEALYPIDRHYSTFSNSISDLGGTVPPDSYMVEPNRGIFIATMAICGALVLGATVLLWSVIRRRRLVVGLGLFGVGLVGIAIFPGNVATWHPLFAMLCFLGGSITAVMSRKVLAAPVSYFATALGLIALVAIVLGQETFETWGVQAAIGLGGTERWIAYPVLLWLVMFGTVLMTQSREPELVPKSVGRSAQVPPRLT